MFGILFKFLAWVFCCPCMSIKIVLKRSCARNVPAENSEEKGTDEMNLTKIETEMDEDVARERARVKEIIENSGGVKSDERVLLASDLEKTYSTRTGPLKAVRGLNLCMKQGECFGLLGVNGAGKTTTFKMMTGDEEITGGEVYVNRYSIKTARSEAQQQIGYCPQFNALIESLTAYETLELFSKLRGMKPEFIESQSDQILKLLGLKIHAEHRCGTYSGGNKRKLSVGLAMVGQPALLFLDEPSTGMDPGARHALWEALSTIRKQGTSIVVTSHSMEECEALCTRLGIMVNGQFKALGSLQHLKNKFGRGYTLELQLNNISSSDKVKDFIETNFKTATLKEEFSSQITYDILVYAVENSDDADKSVQNSDISLGRIFGLMEENKEELDLQGYSLCQRTLEQIFLGFTKLQSN